MDAPVLVVGAGPTGLMLANQLVRHGVCPLIIDRHAGPTVQTRALGVQARSLEIYRHLGIVEQALALGKQATGATIWTGGRPAAQVPLAATGTGLTPYPFLLILGQDDNERLLEEALRARGVTVQWNTELVKLEQHADHATVTLTQDGAPTVVTAGWVAGCDGARSTVREACGIPFEGAPYEQVFYVADVRMQGPMLPERLNVYLWRAGFHLFFPMRGPDHWRIVGILPPALRGRDDLRLDDLVPSIQVESGSGLTFQECSWLSTYRIHHRRAAQFRAGRCFVLGDAAHIHSPVGAQGMNTGLQDAYNLAWKLALVIQGRADGRLLDSYEAERLPVATALLNTTDRGFTLVVSDRKVAGVLRTSVLAKVLGLAMRVGRIREIAFRTISQTGIRYRRSALSETGPGLPASAPRAGDRFPWVHLALTPNGPTLDLFEVLDDTRFTLLAMGQGAPPGAAQPFGAAVHEIPREPANDRELERVGIPVPSFYLVRPDGYVGMCGRHLEAATLAGYAARLSLRARSA